MNNETDNEFFNAYAVVKGSGDYEGITGTVIFRQARLGVLVTANIQGLPTQDNACDKSSGVFAFHIHQGESCSGDSKDAFGNAKGHYDNKNCPHPYHAGDMPPLFSNDGYAYMQFLTNRFTVEEIINKVVIIHDGTDDFKTQPSGDSGKKIACGKIYQDYGK